MDAQVFPMYHVLADVAKFVGGEVAESKSSEPLKVNGLVLHKHKHKRTCVLLANLTDEMQSVSLSRLGAKLTVKL
jgi:hypothetical protein